MGQGILLAGVMANKIFFAGAKLPEFKIELISMVAVMIFIVVGPMLLFAPRLERSKRAGLIEYGKLAQRYVHDFDQKWLRGGAPADEHHENTSFGTKVGPIVAPELLELATLWPAKAFNIPRSYETAEMLRGDLKAAEIAEKADGFTVDFHALRHTFITNLAQSGVHPEVAEDLARHSDINLTMSRYSHTVMEQRAEAVAKLPALRSGTAVVVKTGTGGMVSAVDSSAASSGLSCRPACCSSTENGESVRTGTASVSYEAPCAGVAEWQTQWIQNPPGATP